MNTIMASGFAAEARVLKSNLPQLPPPSHLESAWKARRVDWSADAKQTDCPMPPEWPFHLPYISYSRGELGYLNDEVASAIANEASTGLIGDILERLARRGSTAAKRTAAFRIAAAFDVLGVTRLDDLESILTRAQWHGERDRGGTFRSNVAFGRLFCSEDEAYVIMEQLGLREPPVPVQSKETVAQEQAGLFGLCFAGTWQATQMVRHFGPRQGSIVSGPNKNKTITVGGHAFLDATHNTTGDNLLLTTIMVQHQKLGRGIPICYFLHRHGNEYTLTILMSEFRAVLVSALTEVNVQVATAEEVASHISFSMDFADAERNAVKTAFGDDALIIGCFFHYMKRVKENAGSYFSGKNNEALRNQVISLARRLATADTDDKFQAVMAEYGRLMSAHENTTKNWKQYFKSQWLHAKRVEMWARSKLPKVVVGRITGFTNNIIESWHKLLKEFSQLLNKATRLSMRRVVSALVHRMPVVLGLDVILDSAPGKAANGSSMLETLLEEEERGRRRARLDLVVKTEEDGVLHVQSIADHNQSEPPSTPDEDNTVYRVNMNECSCTCPQTNQSVCRHIFACVQFLDMTTTEVSATYGWPGSKTEWRRALPLNQQAKVLVQDMDVEISGPNNQQKDAAGLVTTEEEEEESETSEAQGVAYDFSIRAHKPVVSPEEIARAAKARAVHLLETKWKTWVSDGKKLIAEALKGSASLHHDAREDIRDTFSNDVHQLQHSVRVVNTRAGRRRNKRDLQRTGSSQAPSKRKKKEHRSGDDGQ